jgi:hypothetical protein
MTQLQKRKTNAQKNEALMKEFKGKNVEGQYVTNVPKTLCHAKAIST